MTPAGREYALFVSGRPAMHLALMMDFAGSGVEVSAGFLLSFVGVVMLLPLLALYFNLRNHDELYIDEHWGDGSIDDDEWGLAIGEARRSANRKLAELAERATR